MKKCFVIQPFDAGKFDDRYEDTYKPAIEAAGLEAYRVDKDPGAKILIDDIEQNIRECAVCLAEITDNNPNVWYELGFAFASGKDVVMICENTRDKFPFDIGHKAIISYKASSVTDFKKLGVQITNKIKAFLESNKQAEKIIVTPIKETKGLSGFQIALLIFVFQSSFCDDTGIPNYSLIKEMGKAGYNELATGIALKSLEQMKMIKIEKRTPDDYNSAPFNVCTITEIGENWILENQGQFEYNKSTVQTLKSEDIPF
ncbi:MAG: hypothetical protein K0R14_1140 [Burkholderiales bacterium]|jgi:nucleoside 2-deoxyribosyltransferase|nr:hypothetical protein [Burkholderiales bacterium]